MAAELGIKATYCTESVTYYECNENDCNTQQYCYNDNNNDEQTAEILYSPISIQVKSATTTQGRNVVSDTHDVTGIMIWPATHLLCQYLLLPLPPTLLNIQSATQKATKPTLFADQHVVELGCGVGLVGVTAFSSSNGIPALWVSTDVDTEALSLCKSNFEINGVDTNDANSHVWVRQLKWGDKIQIATLLKNLESDYGVNRFDCVVGADIIYPSTCGSALKELFETVDQILKPNGWFCLSFATRDGAKTPARLINVASTVGFAIHCMPSLNIYIQKQLPPLLDSKLLLMIRSGNASAHNNHLGRINCSIFPGLKDALERVDNPSSDEEWDPPFHSDSE